MAWYGRYGYDTAGDLKAFFDYIVTNYGQDENGYGWTIKDANAGTNIGVYQCQPDANSKFVLVIKDNQTGYANVEYWDDWDAVNHVGVGNSMTIGKGSYNLILCKKTGQWFAAIDKDRVVFVCVPMNMAYYLGYPDRFDTSYNTPLFIGWNSSNSSQGYYHNPLGWNDTANATPEWRAFRAVSGTYSVQSYGYPTGFITLTPDSKYLLCETVVVCGNYALGKLKGVFSKFTAAPVVYSNQRILVNGIYWLAVRANSGSTEYGMCYIRES